MKRKRIASLSLLLVSSLLSSCIFGSTGDSSEERWATLVGIRQWLDSQPATLELQLLYTDGEPDPDLTTFSVTSGGSDYRLVLDSSSQVRMEKVDIWISPPPELSLPNLNSLAVQGGAEPAAPLPLHTGDSSTLPVVDPDSPYATPFETGTGELISGYHLYSATLEGRYVHTGPLFRAENLPRGTLARLDFHVSDWILSGEIRDAGDTPINRFEIHTGPADLFLTPRCSTTLDAGSSLSLRSAFKYREFFVDLGSDIIVDTMASLGSGTHVIDPWVHPEILSMILSNMARPESLYEFGCVVITL